MDRIVHEHYPVERLPADLRPEPGATHVRVVVEAKMSDEDILADLDRKLQEGLDDLAAGRSYSLDEVRESLRARYMPSDR